MSYPSSYYDINPIHDTVHLQQMRDIAQEKIETEVPEICRQICYGAINKAFSGLMSGIELDVNRIIDITCKDLSAQFHSEEVSKFIAETLKAEVIKGLSNLDLSIIIS